MRKICFILFFSFLFISVQKGNALPNPIKYVKSEYIVEKILSTVQKYGAKTLCKKGDAKSGIFSLRSFNGNAANVSQTLAAFGVLVCFDNNEQEFVKSEFYKKALKKLDIKQFGDAEKEKVTKIFENKVRSAKRNVLGLMCTAAAAGLLATEVGAPIAPVLLTTCKAANLSVKEESSTKKESSTPKQ